MKKLLIVIAIAVSAQYSFAQGLQLGVRAGLNNGTLSTKIPNVTEGPIQRSFTGGVFGRVSLLGFFVQPEINYSQRKGNFETNGILVQNYTNTLNYIDVNAMFGYSLLGILRVNFGPSLMTLVGTSQDVEAGQKDNNYGKDFYKSTAWGLQVGAGVDIGKICIDLRYDTNLSNLGEKNVNSTNFGNPTDYSTGYNMFQITLGYKIIKI